MAKFSYKARDRKGNPVTGSLEADSPFMARRVLAQQELIPISVTSSEGLGGVKKFFESIFAPLFAVPFEEILVFNQQLQTAYSVGIPMVQALGMIESQTKHPKLKKAIAEAAEDVRKGKYLADAFQKHPHVFDSVYITLVRAGEQAGQLDAFLERLAELLERRAENKAKVKSATFYPKLVLGFLGIVNLVFVYFLLPKIKQFFASNGAELPMVTRLVIGVSDFFVEQWPLVILVFGGIYTGWRYWLSTALGRLTWDRIRLKAPVLGELFLNLDLNAFCFVTEILVRSGIPILETLSIVRTSVDNQVVAVEVGRCQDEVKKGGKFSSGLVKSKVFPSIFSNLLAMGEEAGKLEVVLAKVGAHYKREVDYKLGNLSKLLEPILMAIIFGMVGVLALAIMLPIWQLSRVMQGQVR